MGNIKIKTNKEHRFNKVVNIKGIEVKVDTEGVTEVPEQLVVYALNAGFELVDKNVKFSTEVEQKHTKETQAIIKAAEKRAEQIIAEAQKEAERLLTEAAQKIEGIRKEKGVDEKEAKKQELLSMSNEQLKAALAEAKVDDKLWKEAKKEVLVDLIMKIAFEEE